MSNKNVKENPYFNIPEDFKDIQAYHYEMSKFEDELVEMPWTFEFEDKGQRPNGNRIVELIPFFGTQIQEGTPINQRYLGNMDVAIYLLWQTVKELTQRVLTAELRGDASDSAILNGFIAVQFYTSLMPKDIEGRIEILDGYYDKDRGELSV